MVACVGDGRSRECWELSASVVNTQSVNFANVELQPPPAYALCLAALCESWAIRWYAEADDYQPQKHSQDLKLSWHTRPQVNEVSD
jgi:hypothetical protein